MSDLVNVLRSFDAEFSNRARTHSESCWTRHLECAATVAADELERLYVEVNELRLQVVTLSIPEEARRG